MSFTGVTIPDWMVLVTLQRSQRGDGAPVEVLLHVVDGYMSDAEVVPYSAGVRFPDPHPLTVWTGDSGGE